MTLTAIQSLTMDDLREIIASAIRGGLDSDVLDGFVAWVDWTGHASSNPDVREALGCIESWTTAYREGELSLAVYAGNLLSILSAPAAPAR